LRVNQNHLLSDTLRRSDLPRADGAFKNNASVYGISLRIPRATENPELASYAHSLCLGVDQRCNYAAAATAASSSSSLSSSSSSRLEHKSAAVPSRVAGDVKIATLKSPRGFFISSHECGSWLGRDLGRGLHSPSPLQRGVGG